MNMNYNYLTTIFRSNLTQIYVFLVFFTFFHFNLETFISKICKYIFFYQNFVHLGENSSKYCSRIIVDHVHETVFSEFTQRVTILQTVSNQEVTIKRLISMLRIVQKLYLGM